MEKLGALWQRIVDSLWFVPSVLTLMAALLAMLLLRSNDALVGELDAAELWWLFGGSADGARSVLEAISGSIMTVTGVVFSVTIIALQLASTQFTPRVLRQFMADRSNQLVLGVFIGTFTYTLLVQRTVNGGDVGEEFIPELAVTVALLLTLISIGFLIYFIDHAARSVQVAHIIDSVANDSVRAVHAVFPQPLEDGNAVEVPAAEDLARLDPGAGTAVAAVRAGYLQALAGRDLVELAKEHGVVLRLEVEIGAHLLPGKTVMTAWPRERVSHELRRKLCDALILGLERTQHNDVKHGVIELMDIAVKAMSPSVNDPTTAVNSIHRLAEILLEMAWRERGDTLEHDNGRPLVILRRPRLSDTVDLAFNQIRHYAAENPTVAIVLIETLAHLTALSPAAARAPFLDHLQKVIRTATQEISDDADLRRVQRAAAEALGLADSPPPSSRPMK
jgi:uncharacterized membrane protein